MAKREAKNFYWGFISLPHERMAIYALYNYARISTMKPTTVGVDPARASGGPSRARERRRGDYGDDDPIMQILGAATQRYSIPERELQC